MQLLGTGCAQIACSMLCLHLRLHMSITCDQIGLVQSPAWQPSPGRSPSPSPAPSSPSLTAFVFFQSLTPYQSIQPCYLNCGHSLPAIHRIGTELHRIHVMRQLQANQVSRNTQDLFVVVVDHSLGARLLLKDNAPPGARQSLMKNTWSKIDGCHHIVPISGTNKQQPHRGS